MSAPRLLLLLAGVGLAASAQAQIAVTSWEQAREQLRSGLYEPVVWHLEQGNLRADPNDPGQSWLAGAAYFDQALPMALQELSEGGLDAARAPLEAASRHLEAARSRIDAATAEDRSTLETAIASRLLVLSAITREAEIREASGGGGSPVKPIVAQELLESVRPNGAIHAAVLTDLTRVREKIAADAAAIDGLEREIANFQKKMGQRANAIENAKKGYERVTRAEEGKPAKPEQIIAKLAELQAELARFQAAGAGAEASGDGAPGGWPDWGEDAAPLAVLENLAGPGPKRVVQARKEAERLLATARSDAAGKLAPGLADLVSDEFDFALGMELKQRLDELEALLRDGGATLEGGE